VHRTRRLTSAAIVVFTAAAVTAAALAAPRSATPIGPLPPGPTSLIQTQSLRVAKVRGPRPLNSHLTEATTARDGREFAHIPKEEPEWP
jgi:hypothetical protein